MPAAQYTHLVVLYSRWIFLRALLHRGWWLVTSLYLVIEAQLSPLQLVLVGTAQGVAVLLSEVPTGLLADRYSRKWSIVVSHLLMGASMVLTSLVTSFEAVVLTQMLWGISWTFSSGADVAWFTDEVNEPDRIGQYLAVAARWELIGSAPGLVIFGLLAWQCNLSLSMATAGVLMCILGVFVAVTFTEKRYRKSAADRIAPVANLRAGIRLARSNKTLLCILLVTFLVNGGDEVFNRLYVKHLVDLGMPSILDSVVWLTALGVVALSAGAVTLRFIQSSIQGDSDVRVLYATGCAIGVAGLILFAVAPNYAVAMAGFILVHGIAWNMVRTLGVIWANNQASSTNRATVQSFMSFSENLGEISLGFALAVVAHIVGIAVAVQLAALAVFIAFVLIVRR